MVLLASGCVSSGNPSVMDQGRISQIKVDISTKGDVRRLLGQPNSTSKHSGGYPALYGLPLKTSLTNVETWSYTHINVDVNPATFIPIVGLFAGGATSNLNTFTVVFDDQGIVRHISSTQSQGRSGLGAWDGTDADQKAKNDTIIKERHVAEPSRPELLPSPLTFGVVPAQVTPTIANLMKMDEVGGVFVIAIYGGSFASRAGIQKGDIITKYDNSVLSTDLEQFRALVAATPPGSVVPITIWRNGSEIAVNVQF
jgi:hypothetical protein